MKKLTAILTSALMLAMGTMTLVSCGKDQGDNERLDEKRVMNVTCNPSVEFVLDTEDKVVSVNALNEEGNLILSGEVFVNLSAEDAARLFVEASAEMGFIVEGEATVAKNEISVSFSGEGATELYNSVKSKMDEYLSAEKITATVKQAEAITKEYLQSLVAECAPYLEQAEIAAMEQVELVEKIYESRKETAEFFSQELKNAYYGAKAYVMEQAEIEVLKSKLSAVQKIALDAVYTLYSTQMELIETTRKTVLVDENSPYQLALKSFREAKVKYLEKRTEIAEMEQNAVTEAILAELATLEGLVDSAEEQLLSAGKSANETLDGLKATATEHYNKVVEKLEEYAVKANDHLTEISAKQQEAKTAFFTNFEEDYKAAIEAAESNWAAMKEALEKKAETQV